MLIGCFGLIIALALAHPSGWIPTCPTYRFMGFYCPGCGSMRATHLLLNGQFGLAWMHNPLMLLMGVPLAVGFIIEQLMIVSVGKRLLVLPRSAFLAWAALLVLLGFALARNLPGSLGESLRPPDAHLHDALDLDPAGDRSEE